MKLTTIKSLSLVLLGSLPLIVWGQGADTDGSLDLDLTLDLSVPVASFGNGGGCGSGYAPDPEFNVSGVLAGSTFALRLDVQNESSSEGSAFDIGLIVNVPADVTLSSPPVNGQLLFEDTTTFPGRRVIAFETTDALREGDRTSYALQLQAPSSLTPGSMFDVFANAYADDSPFERGVPPADAPPGTTFGGVDFSVPSGASALPEADDDAPASAPVFSDSEWTAYDQRDASSVQVHIIAFTANSEPSVVETERATGTQTHAFTNAIRLQGNSLAPVESIVFEEVLANTREFLGFGPASLPAGLTASALANEPSPGETTLRFTLAELGVDESVEIEYRSAIPKYRITNSTSPLTTPSSGSVLYSTDLNDLILDGFDVTDGGELSTTTFDIVSADYNGSALPNALLGQGDSENVEAEFLAINTSLSAGEVVIGDFVTATVNYSVSEYYGLRGPGVIRYTLTDGAAFEGVASVVTSGAEASRWTFDPTSGVADPVTGDTEIRFLLAEGQGLSPASTGSISFDFVIDDLFEGPGEVDFEASETLVNTVTAEALIDDASESQSLLDGLATSDSSASCFTNPRPTIEKVLLSVRTADGTLYDATGGTPVFDASSVIIEAGSLLEFALIARFPDVRTLGVTITDYLPLITGPNDSISTSRFIVAANETDIFGNPLPINDDDRDGTPDSDFNNITNPDLIINNGIEFNFNEVAPGAVFAWAFTTPVRDIRPEELSSEGLITTRNVGVGSYEDDEQNVIDTFEDEVEFSLSFPFLTIEKNVVTVPDPLQAGDTIQYEIRLENTGKAPAYVPLVSDQLPPNLSFDGAGSVTILDDSDTSIASSPVVMDDGSGGLSFYFRDANGSTRAMVPVDNPSTSENEGLVVIRYEASTSTSVYPGEVLLNTAAADYFSVPTGGSNFGPVSGDETVTIQTFVVSKTIAETSETFTTGNNVAIGEIVTYDVSISVPESTAQNVRFQDQLPNTMELLSAQITSIDPAFSVSANTPVLSDNRLGDGLLDRLEIDFGTITNLPDGDDSPEDITIRYTALVKDDAANINGDRLRNNAQLFQDGSLAANSRVNAFVREAVLDIGVTVDNAYPDASDIVEYTVTLSHATGSALPAHNTAITNLLPPDLEFIAFGPVSQQGSGTIDLPPLTGDGSTLNPVLLDNFTLPLGDEVSFTFTARVPGDVEGTDRFTNIVTGAWSSLPGLDPEERISDNTSFVDIQVRGTNAIKSITDTSLDHTANLDVTIGEIVTYDIVVDVAEASYSNFEVRDVLPIGMEFLQQQTFAVSASVEVNGQAGNLVSPLAPSVSPDGQTLTWTIGSINNTNRENSETETITIQYNAVVTNIAGNVAGTVLSNSVQTFYAGGSGQENTASLTIREPSLTLDLQILEAPLAAKAGDEVLYQLTVANANGDGDLTAYDVFLENALPAEVAFVSGTLQFVDGLLPISDFPASDVLNLSWPAVQPGESSTVTFKVVLNSDITNETTLSNGSSLSWTGQQGSVASTPEGSDLTGERTGDTNDNGGNANTYSTADVTNLQAGYRIAFEDLLQQTVNDFDYNDVIIQFIPEETYNQNDELTQINLVTELEARGATLNHRVVLDLNISGGADVSINRYDSGGALLSQENFISSDNPVAGIVLFESTEDALPGWGNGSAPFAANTDPAQSEEQRIKGHKTEVSVTVLQPDSNPRVDDNPVTLHLDEHFAFLYGASIEVIGTDEVVTHPWFFDTGSQDVVSGILYPDAELLGYPIQQSILVPGAWEHPWERTPAWDSHGLFNAYMLSGRTQELNWPLENVDRNNTWPTVISSAKASIAGSGAASLKNVVSEAISGTPVSIDCNGQGAKEIFAGLFDGRVQVFSGTDITTPVLTLTPQDNDKNQTSQSSPALFQNVDGHCQVFRGDESGSLHVWTLDSSLNLIDYDMAALNGTIKGTAAIANIDGIGNDEVVVQTGDSLLYILDAEMLSSRPNTPIVIGEAFDSQGHTVLTPSPALANMDVDPELEIIAVSADGVVNVMNPDGSQIPGFPIDLSAEVFASPALGDIDGNGTNDIIIATNNAFVHAIDNRGIHLQGWPTRRFFGGPSSPMLADTDQDGLLEVFVGSLDGSVYGWSSAGINLTGFPVATPSGINASPFPADIDGDGVVEILCGNDSGRLNVVSATDGTVLEDFTQEAGALILTTGTVGDVNDDGFLDVVYGSHSGVLGLLSTEVSLAENEPLWNGFRRGSDGSGNLEDPVEFLLTSSVNSIWLNLE